MTKSTSIKTRVNSGKWNDWLQTHIYNSKSITHDLQLLLQCRSQTSLWNVCDREEEGWG